MIISNAKRFALLAPWKTASTTLLQRLQDLNESPYSQFYHYNPHLQRVVHRHLTYPDFAMLPEARLGYFTGAFVRNPYDRVYSGFIQLQRDIKEQPGADFPTPWVKSLVMRQLSDNFAQLAAADFDFDKWWRSVDEHQVFEVGRNSSFPLHPAFFWTGVGGAQKLDFVGRVETFEADFDRFCLSVGIEPPAERTSGNVTGDTLAPHAGFTSRYADRMSPYSISKINALFAGDFERFGYQPIQASALAAASKVA